MFKLKIHLSSPFLKKVTSKTKTEIVANAWHSVMSFNKLFAEKKGPIQELSNCRFKIKLSFFKKHSHNITLLRAPFINKPSKHQLKKNKSKVVICVLYCLNKKNETEPHFNKNITYYRVLEKIENLMRLEEHRANKKNGINKVMLSIDKQIPNKLVLSKNPEDIVKLWGISKTHDWVEKNFSSNQKILEQTASWIKSPDLFKRANNLINAWLNNNYIKSRSIASVKFLKKNIKEEEDDNYRQFFKEQKCLDLAKIVEVINESQYFLNFPVIHNSQLQRISFELLIDRFDA